MDNQVYTYALVKSFYDTGKDYIDCFAPFIVQTLPEGTVKHLTDIQDSVKEITGITIPQYTLKTILKRSRKRGYIDSLGYGRYKITRKGSAFLQSLDTQDTVQRKLNALSSHFNVFLTSHLHKAFDNSEAFALLRMFIESNLILALDYLNPDIEHPSRTSLGLHTSVEKHINNYIEDIRLHSNEHYNTFREIVLGCTLSIALFCPDISSIKEKFKSTTLYLDSNFIFSILGFHYKQFVTPAKELFQMLKRYSFKIKIFHTTVDEICYVMNRFSIYENLYTPSVRVDSIYSQLKSEGWKSSDSRDFILSIEDKLNKLGIQIETLEDIDITSYIPPDEQLLLILEQYKPGQPRAGKNHDLISIEQVKKRRRHTVRNVQHARVFFLTSDLRLAKFNFEQFGHKANCTISEVIPDFLLANFLWLQNPQSSLEMPLKLLISAHSQHLFVERKVWERFISVIRQLKDDRFISDEKIATLIYHGHLEDILRDLDDSQCDVITTDFVMTQIEKASVEIDKKIATKLKEGEAELKALFEEKFSNKESQRSKEWLSRITKIKAKLRKSAAKKASCLAFLVSALATIGIVAVVTGLFCFGLKKCGQNQILALLTVVIIAVGGGGILGLWRDLYKFLKSSLSERFYVKKLKEAGLEIDN